MDLKKDYSLYTLVKSFMNFEDPTYCTAVVVGGEFINKIDAVMDKLAGMINWLDELTRLPEAVFLFLPETYPDSIFSKDKRNRMSPMMVNIIVLQFKFIILILLRFMLKQIRRLSGKV